MDIREGLPKLLGKYLCVYCLKPEESSDHTPPKRLLREPFPANLITLPCCKKCNSSYSPKEEAIRTFLAIVSSHPDLQTGTRDGDAARRGLARNAKLRALIDAQRTANGFKISPELFKIFEAVFRKTVLGLFFARYKQLRPLKEFRVLSIEDARSTTLDNVVDRIRPRVVDVTDQPLSEVSDSMLGRTFVMGATLMPLSGGITPMQLQRVVRFTPDQPIEWVETQPGIFKFGFLQRQPEGGAACIMELWNTLIVTISAPWPGDRGGLLKGRNNPLSRERDQSPPGRLAKSNDRQLDLPGAVPPETAQ